MISGAVVCSRLAIDPPLDWAARAAGVPHRPSIAVTPAANKPRLLPRGNSHRPTHSARRKMRLALAAATIVAIIVAATAATADASVKRLAWTKAVAVWKADAKKHGVTAAECTAWSPTVSTLMCEFTKGASRWQAILRPGYGQCSYSASFSAPRATDPARLEFVQSQDVRFCAPGWWKRLLTPWSAKLDES